MRQPSNHPHHAAVGIVKRTWAPTWLSAHLVFGAGALLMAAGSGAGGYLAARVARRAPQAAVRGLVVVIGLASAAWLAVRR